MKALTLLSLLSIISCTTTPPVSSPYTYYTDHNATPTSVHSHMAVDTSDNVRVLCEQKEVNEALVWISCLFENTSAVPSEACIRVRYVSNDSWFSVENRIPSCSGTLQPGSTFENYVAFAGPARGHINFVCGKDVENCFMWVVRVLK